MNNNSFKNKSGYNIFMGIKMCEFKEANTVEPKDRMKEVGKLWKLLSEEEKDIYHKKAEEENKKREASIGVNNQKPFSISQSSEVNNDIVATPNTTPYQQGLKKQSAYSIFCAKMIPILKKEGMNGKDCLVETGMRWKNLTQDEKAEYQKIADEKNDTNGQDVSKAVVHNKNKKCSDSEDSECERSRDNDSDSDE
jgi:hypothetical protein